jgi:hypothetical protein
MPPSFRREDFSKIKFNENAFNCDHLKSTVFPFTIRTVTKLSISQHKGKTFNLHLPFKETIIAHVDHPFGMKLAIFIEDLP